MNSDKIMNELNPPKPPNFSEVARRAGVSRATIYNVQKTPENTTLKVLRRIFEAMGYELILSLKEIDE